MGFSDNAFIIVFMGMLTGVGGGIFRDILIDTTPYVLKKHIYAIATILGAVIYFLLRRYFQSIEVASVVSMTLVFSFRMLATIYRWSLPIRRDYPYSCYPSFFTLTVPIGNWR